MGMPNLPSDISTKIDIEREGLVNLLLTSIALEELSLSHLLNAEAEMMQFLIQKLKHERYFSLEDFIKINRSVSDALLIILEKENTLKDKLIHVIHFDEHQKYKNHYGYDYDDDEEENDKY